jgi:RNA recognition motif-containing protein
MRERYLKRSHSSEVNTDSKLLINLNSLESVLYVGDLSISTTAENIKKVFSSHGEIISCEIVADPITQ